MKEMNPELTTQRPQTANEPTKVSIAHNSPCELKHTP